MPLLCLFRSIQLSYLKRLVKILPGFPFCLFLNNAFFEAWVEVTLLGQRQGHQTPERPGSLRTLPPTHKRHMTLSARFWGNILPLKKSIKQNTWKATSKTKSFDLLLTRRQVRLRLWRVQRHPVRESWVTETKEPQKWLLHRDGGGSSGELWLDNLEKLQGVHKWSDDQFQVGISGQVLCPDLHGGECQGHGRLTTRANRKSGGLFGAMQDSSYYLGPGAQGCIPG